MNRGQIKKCSSGRRCGAFLQLLIRFIWIVHSLGSRGQSLSMTIIRNLGIPIDFYHFISDAGKTCISHLHFCRIHIFWRRWFFTISEFEAFSPFFCLPLWLHHLKTVVLFSASLPHFLCFSFHLSFLMSLCSLWCDFYHVPQYIVY